MTYRTDPPPHARLGLYRHGDTVSEKAALELVGRSDFSEHWLILPSEGGELLSLMWGDACTTEQLTRAAQWNTLQRVAMRASRLSRGEA